MFAALLLRSQSRIHCMFYLVIEMIVHVTSKAMGLYQSPPLQRYLTYTYSTFIAVSIDFQDQVGDSIWKPTSDPDPRAGECSNNTMNNIMTIIANCSSQDHDSVGILLSRHIVAKRARDHSSNQDGLRRNRDRNRNRIRHVSGEMAFGPGELGSLHPSTRSLNIHANGRR